MYRICSKKYISTCKKCTKSVQKNTLAQIGGDKIKYIMIPKKIIHNNTLDYRRIIYYTFFATRKGLCNEVGYTMNYLIEWSGFKFNRSKPTNEYDEIINYFIENDFMEIEKYTYENTYLVAKVKDEFGDTDGGFAIIYLDELEKIRNCSKYIEDAGKTTSATLLLLLAYLRLNIMRRGKNYLGSDEDKPEFCYRMFNKIAEDVGLSSRIVSKGIKQLSDLGITSYVSLPRFKTPNNEWHTHVTIFVDKYRRDENGNSVETYDYKQELEWGKAYVFQNKNQTKFNQSSGI